MITAKGQLAGFEIQGFVQIGWRGRDGQCVSGGRGKVAWALEHRPRS